MPVQAYKVYPSRSRRFASAAGNGLLTGLTEAWEPDATKAMIGQKTGLNTGTDAALTYVVQAGFPTGHALQNANGEGSGGLSTSASALLSAIGNTDFLLAVWNRVSADADAQPNGFIGESNNNGIDWGANFGGWPSGFNCEMPGGDGSYQPAVNSNPDTPFTATAAHMMAFWYTNADDTLHMSLDGGTAYSVVNTVGIANADLTNFIRFAFGPTTGNIQQGPAYLWQGTTGVANAVSKLATLYGSKLQYSDFT